MLPFFYEGIIVNYIKIMLRNIMFFLYDLDVLYKKMVKLLILVK